MQPSATLRARSPAASTGVYLSSTAEAYLPPSMGRTSVPPVRSGRTSSYPPDSEPRRSELRITEVHCGLGPTINRTKQAVQELFATSACLPSRNGNAPLLAHFCG